MTLKPATAILCTALVSAFVGCEVRQTEEGRAPNIDVQGDAGELPDYDIVKEEEGRAPSVDVQGDVGDLPSYDVDAPEVDVTTKEQEVTVPDVDVNSKETTVTVPDVEVTPADEDND